ncbi:SMI1/KNR4 family protein [Actinomadura sp. WMMB 499]|uniref:SMI1/KNR4 family protein n=1 Tax=Actinomadura sp. WMMB 499 TaxID=1219491 RepID=UPI0012451F99|nr:SMI1/KNR4 family protein [Actinomadura sp. WMMB 499]QFG23465.1 SMI1/KNR4 family protein [Actinomadura sp. WMMB 499]
MTGFDIVRDLPAALHDREAAWTYVRGFAAHWGVPLGPGDGTPGTELDAAEGHLGVRLPAAVREAYALFGRRPDLHTNLHGLLAPDDFYLHAGGVVFREEHQGVATWGVLVTDMHAGDAGAPDPPVRISMDDEPWKPWYDTFSVACLEILLTEATQSEDLCDHRDLDAGDDLERHFTRVPLPFPGDTVAFYAGPGVLLCDAVGMLSVRARDQETLDRFRDAHPGPWLNG